MAYTKRKRYARRPYMRRRRPYRRFARTVRSRVRAARRRQVHQFKRSCQKLQIQGNAIYAPYTNAFTFSLSDLPVVSDFASLYDQYKLNFVILKIRLYNTPDAQSGFINSSNYPTLYYVKDYDDDSIPTSLNQLREHGDCQTRVLRPNAYTYIKLKPRLLSPIYVSALSTTYAPIRARPIDFAQTTTPHYGMKFAIDNFTNINMLVDMQADYYFTCYGTR